RSPTPRRRSPLPPTSHGWPPCWSWTRRLPRPVTAMKYVVLQGDGMADEPIAELGGKTPLEYARTPNLDHMASRGILGLTRTIPRGLPPGSDVGTMSVLGYDPTRYHTGRSPIEAASMGVELGADDIAFRCNLVTLETPEGGTEIMRDFAAGHPPSEEAAEVVRDMNRALGRDGLEFHPGVSYRHLLVWRGGESRMRTTPPHDLSDKPVAGHFPDGPGAEVLRDLMERSRRFLAEHPLCQARAARGERAPTSIWLWGQGKRPRLPTLRERFGVEGSVIAAVDLVNGLGVLAGLKKIAVPGATGFLDSNFLGKAQHGLRALAEREFLFPHVAAPDEGGHMGAARQKRRKLVAAGGSSEQPFGSAASGALPRIVRRSRHGYPASLLGFPAWSATSPWSWCG